MAWPKGKPGKPMAVDLVGRSFTRLTVVARAPSRGNAKAYWQCKCECGREVIVSTSDLSRKHTMSCGCLNAEVRKEKALRHGFNRTRTHVTWCAMWARCTNPKLRSFKHYGGRGITVCERWTDFANFVADMGERPEGRSIDRIDVNGHYEPVNCRWATPSEQRRNQRAAAQLAQGAGQPEGGNG